MFFITLKTSAFASPESLLLVSDWSHTQTSYTKKCGFNIVNHQVFEMEAEEAKLTETNETFKVILQVTGICWDRCMKKRAGEHMRDEEIACLEQCTERYFDSMDLCLKTLLTRARSVQ
jgi:hypothetical protein